jgi:hypothetical protein
MMWHELQNCGWLVLYSATPTTIDPKTSETVQTIAILTSQRLKRLLFFGPGD